MAGLLDFFQSASNAAASNLSAPVDGINWLLKKAGMPTSDAPYGGSDWMARQGLTRPVEQSASSLAGETMGLLAPMAAAAKGPQIAKGLLAMGENASTPSTLNKQAGMILYHGSNDSRPITQIKDSGVFGGLFASPSEGSAASHGSAMYRMTIPDEKVMGMGADVPWGQARGVIDQHIRKGSQYADDITDMALGAKSAFNSSIPEGDLLHALRASDLGEADWALQRLRGEIGKNAGYKAVAMPDEHGMSYLVLPGTTPRPANEQSRLLARGLGSNAYAPSVAAPIYPPPAALSSVAPGPLKFQQWEKLPEAEKLARAGEVVTSGRISSGELSLLNRYKQR